MRGRHRKAQRGGAWVLALFLLASAASAQDIFGGKKDGLSFGEGELHIGVFGNVDFVADSVDGENEEFQDGALDLYLTAQISPRWSGLIELVFENDGNDLVTDLERFQVTYQHSDALNVEFGRFHNPLIRWNILQHHGLYLQTTIDKPRISDWEDEPGLWPVHVVGAYASGQLSNTVGLSWGLGIGNGRSEILDEIQVGSDLNSSKAVIAAVGVAPAALPGFELHLTSYFDEIPALQGDTDEEDFTISASYLASGFEIQGEWARMDHEIQATNEDFETTGWYLLVAKRLRGRFESVKPYLLIDSLDAAEEEDFLEGAEDEDAIALGLRWDVSRAVALKADVRSQEIGNRDREEQIRFQLAFSM